MPRSDTYVYQPLDTSKEEIRLLHLSPHQDIEARLEGRLEVVPLDTHLQFQSLSYVWGQSITASEPLHLGDSTLEITLNLLDALRAVRSRDVRYPIWCDRICINQDDLDERNRQVQLMRRIFIKASMVNIWLGPEFLGTSAAFALLRDLADGKPFSALLQTNGTTPSMRVECLIEAFKHPWWRRLWTIQEALLAKLALVHCGSWTVDLETIFHAFELLWNQLVQQAPLLRKICGADALHDLTRQLELTVRRLHVTRSLVLSQTPSEQRSFRDDPSKWPMVMHNCAWSEATDAREKVYGTLGLFSTALLEVDYSLSLSQTYSKSTFAMIKRLGNLAILTQTVSQRSIDNGLPSWVPDWRSPAKETASLLVFYQYFRAGKHIPLDPVLLHGEMLQISAQYVDEILGVGAVYDDGSSETTKELTVLLKLVIENWILLAGVPGPDRGPFLARFTEPSTTFGTDEQSKNAPPVLPSQPLPQTTTQPGSQPYQLPQSYQAPVYKDLSYSGPEPRHGSKRKAESLSPYMPQQSRFAPVYKDAAYPPQRSYTAPVYKNPTHKSTARALAAQKSVTGPRSYDPFSHTYGPPVASMPVRPFFTTKQAKDSPDPSVNERATPEIFWRTLCMDIVEDQALKKHRRCVTSDSWRVWEWIDWILGRGSPAEIIPQLHWHLTTQLQGKRLVKTKSGRLGLVGRDAQVGDQVWILAGGAYPYVLRKYIDIGDGNAFRCVSTAFIHGLMDGEKRQYNVVKIKIT